MTNETDEWAITVAIPAHPNRLRNGMLNRALSSVSQQVYLPAAVSVAVDLEKQGAAPTRQRALDAVATPWVAFLDSDDYFLPEHLDYLMRHAMETGADYVYPWYQLLDVRGKLWKDVDPVFPPTHFSEPFDPQNPVETTITTLVRTDLAKEVGFEKMDRGEHNSGEDRRFTLDCLAAGAKIEHLAERTWVWAHHGKNSSGLPGKGDA